MTRNDPMHTSVCTVCWQGTWYADTAITLPRDYGDTRPPFVTDPAQWEYGNRAHLHGAPEGTHNLRMVDNSTLAPQFTPYYKSGQRIRVRFGYGEEMTGTVGKTTGWRPSYLLIRRSSDMSSPWLLSDTDAVVAVQRGRKYVEVSR